MHSSLISRNNLIKYGYFAFSGEGSRHSSILAEKSHGQRHLAGNSPWVQKLVDCQLNNKLCFYHVLKRLMESQFQLLPILCVDLGSFLKLSNSVFR